MVDGDLRMVSLNGFDVKSMTYGGLACVSLDLARFRANGPTGISMWAVQLSLKAFARILPSESCCINILADIVTN